jgi:hypothetical protein
MFLYGPGLFFVSTMRPVFVSSFTQRSVMGFFTCTLADLALPDPVPDALTPLAIAFLIIASEKIARGTSRSQPSFGAHGLSFRLAAEADI